MPEPGQLAYASWPFRPLQERSLEENERWWQHCYLPGGAIASLQNEAHWCVLAGGPGSGKSVALAALKRAEAGKSFIVEYPADRWLGAKRAWVPEGNHLAQIMAQAGMLVSKTLAAAPKSTANLTDLQRGFVRWLLQKFNGSRAFDRWVDGLTPDLAAPFKRVPFSDIYPTTDARDAHGQIDELINLIRRIGYQRVLVVFDLGLADGEANLAQLRELYGRDELMDHPGFAIVAALPASIMAAAGIVQAAQGRLSVTHLNWDAAQLRTMVGQHLRAALDRPALELEDFAEDGLWVKIEKLLLGEYEAYSPSGWVAMAETLAYLVGSRNRRLSPPLKSGQFSNIGREFFGRHMPLRLDMAKHGIWRGPKFIVLTDQPLALLERLYIGAGQPISSEELREVSGSPGNLYSITTRLRKQIEPFPDKPIYVHSSRGEGGYWLEHFISN